MQQETIVIIVIFIIIIILLYSREIKEQYTNWSTLMSSKMGQGDSRTCTNCTRPNNRDVLRENKSVVPPTSFPPHEFAYGAYAKNKDRDFVGEQGNNPSGGVAQRYKVPLDMLGDAEEGYTEFGYKSDCMADCRGNPETELSGDEPYKNVYDPYASYNVDDALLRARDKRGGKRDKRIIDASIKKKTGSYWKPFFEDELRHEENKNWLGRFDP